MSSILIMEFCCFRSRNLVDWSLSASGQV